MELYYWTGWFFLQSIFISLGSTLLEQKIICDKMRFMDVPRDLFQNRSGNHEENRLCKG